MNESIETKIELIEADIAAAYTEAEAKGATMPQVQRSANLSTTIRSIPEAVQPTLITKQITANGTYTAADDGADGYSEVTVNVPSAPTPPDPDGVLVLVDWEGTPIASYTHSEAMALTALPNAPDLPFYENVDHEYLLFQEWTHTLQEVKDYLQYRLYGHLLVGAIYTTTDGQLHIIYNNTRIQTSAFALAVKRPFERGGGSGVSTEYLNEPRTSVYLRDMGSLKHINMRHGVTTFQNDACGNASSLKSVVLPPTVTSISYQCFFKCERISYIILHDNITSIGNRAFREIACITKIELPKNLESLGVGAFQNCNQLIDIIIYSKPTLESTDAFVNNSNTRYYVPRENLSYFETATNWASIYSPTRFVAIEDNIDYLEHIGCDVHEYKEAV